VCWLLSPEGRGPVALRRGEVVALMVSRGALLCARFRARWAAAARAA